MADHTDLNASISGGLIVSNYGSITLLIQGPLSIDTLENLERNIDLVPEVIVSSWVTNQRNYELESRISQFCATNPKVKLIFNSLPEKLNLKLPGNLELQILSTSAGLDSSTGRWIIKCRSDEVYDLTQFVERIAASKISTLISSNFIVRNWLYHPFYISDHLFAVERSVLKSAIEALLTGDQTHKLLSYHCQTPESVLGFYLVKALVRDSDLTNLVKNPLKAWSLFEAHFDLIDLRHIGYYRVKASAVGSSHISDLQQLNGFTSHAGTVLNFTLYRTSQSLRPSVIKFVFARYLKPRFRSLNRLIKVK